MKSRTNKAGQSCNLIYNQVTGFDPILSLLDFAEENKLLEGRNPKKYFTSNPDVKFDSRAFAKEFKKNADIRTAIFDSTLPILESQITLPKEDDGEGMSDAELADFMDRFVKSQENEE